MTVTTAEQTTVFETIQEHEPISHDELCDQLNCDWDELQEVIRELRRNDKVRNTLDRRYETV